MEDDFSDNFFQKFYFEKLQLKIAHTRHKFFYNLKKEQMEESELLFQIKSRKQIAQILLCFMKNKLKIRLDVNWFTDSEEYACTLILYFFA